MREGSHFLSSSTPNLPKNCSTSAYITATSFFSTKHGKTISQMLEEVRVCTNRTCRRQGSMQTLQNLTDLSPPNVVVKSCGCLGRCGAGPNVAVLPQGVIVDHCGTASQAAWLVCGSGDCSQDVIRKALDALTLKKRAEAEIDGSNFAQAETLLSQA